MKKYKVPRNQNISRNKIYNKINTIYRSLVDRMYYIWYIFIP